MHRSRTGSLITFLLIILLLIVGVTILWLGVLTMALDRFGASASNLTPFQQWSYSLRLLVYQDDLLNPASYFEKDTAFTIPSGASVTTVAKDLEQNGLIQSWEAFRYYIIYKGYDTEIKAGDFYLSPSMTSVEIAAAIQSTYSAQVSFYIYPGWRAEEIAAALPSSGIQVSPGEFLAVVQNPSGLDLPANMTGLPSLEGFLFPGSYVIDREISARDLALTFVNRFNESVSPDLQSQLQANGLSFYQAIILASIVQRETFDDAERPMIASVFYNRLAAGMKLETDPTVQYALGYSEEWGGWWKTPLSVYDLDVNSPFNTYVISGLPERPISNPDLPSLQAVAHPEASDYYYFRANCDGSGSHVFSQTFEEHLSKACQ